MGIKATTERVSLLLNQILHLNSRVASLDETNYTIQIPKDIDEVSKYKMRLAALTILKAVVSSGLVMAANSYGLKASAIKDEAAKASIQKLATVLNLAGKKITPAAGEVPKAYFDAELSKLQNYIGLDQAQLSEIRTNMERSFRLIEKNSEWKKELLATIYRMFQEAIGR